MAQDSYGAASGDVWRNYGGAPPQPQAAPVVPIPPAGLVQSGGRDPGYAALNPARRRTLANNYGYADVPTALKVALAAAPLPGSSAIGGLINANNVYATDLARQGLGLAPLGVGSYLGGFMGLGRYGRGYIGEIDYNGRPTPVTFGGGLVRRKGQQQPSGSLTPAEYIRRQQFDRVQAQIRDDRERERRGSDFDAGGGGRVSGERVSSRGGIGGV